MGTERGFTLIELVVAMALVTLAIATAAMAAGLATDHLGRADTLLARQRALLSLKDQIEAQPLFRVRAGEGRWREGAYRWRAELLESGPQRSPADGGEMAATALFEVGLFRLDLTLARDRGGERHYDWRAVAYRPWGGDGG